MIKPSPFQAQFDFCHQCVLCHVNSDNVYVNYQENTTNAWTRPFCRYTEERHTQTFTLCYIKV